MLHPSYTDLMKVVNKAIEEGETKVVNSRYSIVMATAKRAREIIDGSMPLVDAKVGEKPLSIAIDEMNQYDYLIINDDLQECVEEMHQIIQGEHRRSFRNAEFIEHMKEELKGE